MRALAYSLLGLCATAFGKDSCADECVLVHQMEMKEFYDFAGISSVTVSGDNTSVYASTYEADNVILWTREPDTGNLLINTTLYHTDLPGEVSITSVFVSPDSKNVYGTCTTSASNIQDAVVIWKRDLISGRLSNRVIEQTDLVGPSAVTVSPDNKNIYVAARGSKRNPGDATIAYWSRSTETGNLTNKRSVPQDSLRYLTGVRDLAVSPDNANVCAAATLSDAVVCWARNASDGGLSDPQVFDTNLRGVRFVAFSPDSLHVYASAASDYAIVHWKRNPVTGIMSNQTVILKEKTSLNSVRELVVSPDGRFLYAASKSVVYWQRDLVTGRLFNQKEVGPPYRYVSLAVSGDGRNVYSVSHDNDAIVYWTLGQPFPWIMVGIAVGSGGAATLVLIVLFIAMTSVRRLCSKTSIGTEESSQELLQLHTGHYGTVYHSYRLRVPPDIPSSRSVYDQTHCLSELQESPHAELRENIDRGCWLPWREGQAPRGAEDLNANECFEIVGQVHDRHADSNWRPDRASRRWPINQRLNGEMQGVNSIVFHATVDAGASERRDVVIKCMLPISEHGNNRYSKSGWLRLLYKPESHFQKAMRPSRHVVPILHHFEGDSALCLPWVPQAFIGLDNIKIHKKTTMVVMPHYPFVLNDLVTDFPYDANMTRERLCALVLLQLCLGVEHLQSEAIAHRDLKPDNVFVDSDGLLAIGDFGTARWLNQDPIQGNRDSHRDEIVFQNPTEQIANGIGAASVQAPELWKWMEERPEDAFKIRLEEPVSLRHVYRKTDVYAVGLMITQLFGDNHCRGWVSQTHKDRYSNDDVPRLSNWCNTIISELVANMLTWDREHRVSACDAATLAQNFLFANASDNVTLDSLQDEIQELRNQPRTIYPAMQISLRLMHRLFLAEKYGASSFFVVDRSVDK